METRERIHALACRHQGDWKKIAKDLAEKTDIEPIPETMGYVTILDENYPPAFRQLRYPPWILFYKGDITLARVKGFGMVGGRLCTEAARENATEIANILKESGPIISGLAKGIDAAAHKAALDRTTIGITGCGLDRTYPKENAGLQHEMEKHHLVLSEYPPGTPPCKHHFPWRNRLIAALSQALVVVECNVKSGTMHTVNECLELGVPVYAVAAPYGIAGIQGTNRLIQDGAQILYDTDSVRELAHGNHLL